jgi:hypothetical protein
MHHIIMTRMSVLRLYCFAPAAVILGCGGSDAPKTPLGEKSSEGVAANDVTPAIAGEARLALDSGNMLFRAKAYDRALSQYRRSAQLAPTELAPLLGIMMVADVTKDSKLSEETLPRIRRLDPAVARSSARMPHSKIIEAHPRPGASRSPRT